MSRIYNHATADPWDLAETKGDALYAEIHPQLSKLGTEGWPSLQAKTSELNREINGAVTRLAAYREDLATPREARVAGWDGEMTAIRSKANSMRENTLAVLDILRAEVTMKARPQLDAEREHFVRDDVSRILEHSADPLRDLVDIAGGAHRGRAALVVGDYADGYLQRLIPDRRGREKFAEGLSAAMIEGSLKHGTPDQMSAAKVAKEVLPKVAGWVATRMMPAMARLKDAEATRP